jgi:hypothetical protein
VQLTADIANSVNQRVFDVHVDVFELDAELKSTLLNFLAYLFEGLHNFLALIIGDKPHFGEHLRVGRGALNIVRIKAAIEAYAFAELGDARVGRLLKNTLNVPLGHEMPLLGAHWVTDKFRQRIHCKQLTANCQRVARARRGDGLAREAAHVGVRLF